MKTRPGEIWLADLGLAAKTRPVVILSRADENPPRQLAVYVPLATQNRGNAYEMELGLWTSQFNTNGGGHVSLISFRCAASQARPFVVSRYF